MFLIIDWLIIESQDLSHDLFIDHSKKEMIAIAVLASVLSAVSAYSKCSPSDVKGPITIPITKVLITSPIQLSGSIEIIDGCTVSYKYLMHSLKLLDSRLQILELLNGMEGWDLVQLGLL